ncbi:MAG: tryptophan--tRNA ligase, partial [Candidatus Colwellbacteria bacterium]|nr:tryptophan--tRNA ligase [Candidatus Colwellbacteria bacterium]
ITTPQEPKAILQNTYELAAMLLACGIDPVRSQTLLVSADSTGLNRTSNGADPKKTTLFLQSDVPAHAELFWILSTLASVGELERMTQYKEKKGASGAMAGILNYPVLQAADILLYQSEIVPVGEDQLQHLELTRTLARRFNKRFGDTFVIPRAVVDKNMARIMGLDDPSKKMSKSAASSYNYILLLDSPDDIRQKIKNAVTDSGKEVMYDMERKPAISNLIAIYAGFSGMAHKEIEKKYAGGGYAEFKHDLAELLVEKLAVIRENYGHIQKNKKNVIEILRTGEKRARETAEKTLCEVKKKIGFALV